MAEVIDSKRTLRRVIDTTQIGGNKSSHAWLKCWQESLNEKKQLRLIE